MRAAELRAFDILQARREPVVPEGTGRWSVASRRGPHRKIVRAVVALYSDTDPRDFACDCPWFVHKGSPCKHIHLVLLYLKLVQPSRAQKTRLGGSLPASLPLPAPSAPAPLAQGQGGVGPPSAPSSTAD